MRNAMVDAYANEFCASYSVFVILVDVIATGLSIFVKDCDRRNEDMIES